MADTKPHVGRAFGYWALLPNRTAQPTQGTVLYPSVRNIANRSLQGSGVLVSTEGRAVFDGQGVLL